MRPLMHSAANGYFEPQTYQSFALQRTTAFRYNPLSWKTPTQYYLYYQIA